MAVAGVPGRGGGFYGSAGGSPGAGLVLFLVRRVAGVSYSTFHFGCCLSRWSCRHFYAQLARGELIALRRDPRRPSAQGRAGQDPRPARHPQEPVPSACTTTRSE